MRPPPFKVRSGRDRLQPSASVDPQLPPPSVVVSPKTLIELPSSVGLHLLLELDRSVIS